MYKVRVLNPNNVRVECMCVFNNNVRVDLLEEVRVARVCFVCFHLLRHPSFARTKLAQHLLLGGTQRPSFARTKPAQHLLLGVTQHISIRGG